MTKSKLTPKQPIEPAKSITEFEVSDGGTLCMANFDEAETRADFYEDVAGSSGSPMHLAEAMDECQPLAWAVESIYSDFRYEIEVDLKAAKDGGSRHKRRLTSLKARLKALPEEPEEGAPAWLLSLTSKEFEDRIVPEIDTWFSEPPDWDSEDGYLPEASTAQGAAKSFFEEMTGDELETLGVEIIEGDHPGSSYYAAELRGDIDAANRAATAAGIPVRFVVAKD